jgi:hypothetical protein
MVGVVFTDEKFRVRCRYETDAVLSDHAREFLQVTFLVR